MASLYTILSSQFPEFVKANHPKIIQFLQSYYQWQEQQSIGKIEDVVNLDTTPEVFVQYFRSQLDKFGLFPSTAPLNRKYVRYIKQLYNSKGSEQALLFLLRLAFSDALIDIRYPSENMLRASDGIWYQQSFITVQRQVGTLRVDELQNITNFSLLFATTRQVIETTQIVVVEQSQSGEVLTLRLYFERVPGITAVVDQEIEIRINNSIVFTGNVVLSPSTLNIKTPGADWLVGQLIQVPGTDIPTVARVTRINTTGGIETVEIVQHGYNHSNPQTLTVSPYRSKPAGTTFDAFDLLAEDGVTVIGTRLELRDSLDSIEEYITGVRSNNGPDRYFAENYNADLYDGSQVINITDQSVTDSSQGFDSSISLETWLLSRATVEVVYSPLVNTKGSWLTGRGQLSNANVRLQDNNYYQQFSYVIDSTVNPSLYEPIAAAVHPAGTKRFNLYTLTTSATTTPSVEISFPFRTLNIEPDLVGATDDITSKQVSKVIPQDQTAINDESLSKNLTKYMQQDSITVSDASQSTYEESFFNAESYFAEIYALNSKTLTLQQ